MCDTFEGFNFSQWCQDMGLGDYDSLLNNSSPTSEGHLGTFDQAGPASCVKLAEASLESRVNPSNPTPSQHPHPAETPTLIPVGVDVENSDVTDAKNTHAHADAAAEQRSPGIPEPRTFRNSEPKICKVYSKLDCFKRFTNQKLLDAHIQKDHKIKPYKCKNAGCTRTASRLDNLKAHVKKCRFGSRNQRRHHAHVSPSTPPDDSQPPEPKRQRTGAEYPPTTPPVLTPQINSAGNPMSSPADTHEAIDIDGLLTPPSSQDASPSAVEPSYSITHPKTLGREAGTVTLTNSPNQRIAELENQVKLLKADRARLEDELKVSKRQTNNARKESKAWRDLLCQHVQNTAVTPSQL